MNSDVMKAWLQALVRYALIAIGTFLVRKGIVGQDLVNSSIPQFTIAIVGFLIVSIPLIWKYFHARFTHQLVQTALNSPPGTPIEKAVETTKEVIANK